MPAGAGQAVVAPPVLLGGGDRNFNVSLRISVIRRTSINALSGARAAATCARGLRRVGRSRGTAPPRREGRQRDIAGIARADGSRSPLATTDHYPAIAVGLRRRRNSLPGGPPRRRSNNRQGASGSGVDTE